MRKTRQSAATAQRIPRPYVAGKLAFTRASERPSGSQDAVGAKLDSPSTAAIVTACASQESFSYVSVSAEQNPLITDALPRLPAGSGGFLLARRPEVAGVTSTTESPQRTEI